MTIKELTTPCGLYCGTCPLYLAYKDKRMAEQISRKYNIPIEAASCIGCRPSDGIPTPCAGKKCSNYSCAEEREHFICIECDDFPCNKLAPAAEKADVIPHNMKLHNLLLIKKHGLEAWVEKVPGLVNQYFNGTIVYGEGPMLPEKKDEA